MWDIRWNNRYDKFKNGADRKVEGWNDELEEA